MRLPEAPQTLRDNKLHAMLCFGTPRALLLDLASYSTTEFLRIIYWYFLIPSDKQRF